MSEHSSNGNRVLHIILGIGLMIPAAISCIGGFIFPTISTILSAFQDVSPLGEAAEFIGLANFERLTSDPIFSGAAGFTALMIVVRLLAVAILPLLLALGVNAVGRAFRISARLVFTVPLALFSPVALALAWMGALNPMTGVVDAPLLADADLVRPTMLFTDGIFVAGIAAGLGLIVFLAVLRGRGETLPEFKQTLAPLIITWGIGLLATIALTLQDFTWSYVLTRGGPANKTMTLGLYQYLSAFSRLRFGYGAAVGFLPLILVLLLGLIAGLLVIIPGLRLELVSSDRPAYSGSRGIFILILVLALLCGIAACGINLAALPAGLTGGPGGPGVRGPDSTPAGAIFIVNTVIIQLIPVLIFQVVITYLAALGIGGLRPLGKSSEWLLLPFTPAFFLTTGLLSVTLFQRFRVAGALNTLGALAAPGWISVPILIVLTLFFKGQQTAYQQARDAGESGAFFKKVILPSLPLTGLLALAAWLIRMQRLQWPLIAAPDPDLYTMPVLLMATAGQYTAAFSQVGSMVAGFLIPTGLFFLIAFGLFQVFYLERLALVRGEPSDEQIELPEDTGEDEPESDDDEPSEDEPEPENDDEPAEDETSDAQPDE